MQFKASNNIHDMKTILYWLPKMHKTSVGSRFIAASFRCTTKPLSRLLTDCLTLVTKHYCQYNAGNKRRCGANCFWIINNSIQVLELLRRINSSKHAKSFNTFDFSTLYTSIPHALLIHSIRELVFEAYKIRDATYICTGYASTFWSNAKHNAQVNITADKLTEYIEYLIDNIYVCAGDKTFKQSIGIPMGTDCAPLLANLFLFFYVKRKLKHNHGHALLSVRYIDDLLTLNNPLFEQEIPHIYPPELLLKKTTESPDMVLFLDICVKLKDKMFCSSVYDKKDDFSFVVAKFPYLDSNIPAKPAYGIYISQLVRIGRICDEYNDFLERHREITSRLVKQGFILLCSTFKKFYRRYRCIVDKFDHGVKVHIKDGIALPIGSLPKVRKFVCVNRR